MDQQFNTPPNPKPNNFPGQFPQQNQPHGGQFPQSNQPHGSQFPQQYQQFNNLSGELPSHPSATTALILGILGWFVPFTCFFAWYIGGKAKKEIEGGAPYRWGGEIVVGYWMGVICSILSIISILFLLFFFGLIIYGLHSAAPM